MRACNGLTKQIWYADDASAGGSLVKLQEWWDQLVEIGPMYGYFVNPTKSYLLCKMDCLDEATNVVGDCNVFVTSDGGRYLGVAIAILLL